MEYRWNFPQTQSLQNIGINADELDNKDSPIQTFVREICQNSNDSAAFRPVRIEFRSFIIDTKEFPNIGGLRETLKQCEKEVSKIDNNDNALKIIRKRISALNTPKMEMMRVSDFNTKGLLGSDTNNSATPWYSLTIGKGISNKKGSAGGSKGRGKDSFYRMSEFNTVFFSTIDIDGLEASIGISKQTTHFDTEGSKRDHFGSYPDRDEKYFRKYWSLDPAFKRTRPGTDIFIPGFKTVDDGPFQMKLAIIRDFFISIIDGDLEVTVDDVYINKDTILNVLNNLSATDEKDKERIVNTMELIECYHQEPSFKNEDYEVYLKESEKFFRITSVRAGMTIDHEFYKRPRENFIGLLVIRSEKASTLLLKSEDISHNCWNESNVEDKRNRKIVSELINEMRDTIRKEIGKLVEKEIGERKDAMGLNRYIPLNNGEISPEIAMKEHLYDHITKVKTIKKNKPIPKKSLHGINRISPTDPLDEGLNVEPLSNDPIYVNDDVRPEYDSDSKKHNVTPGTDESFKRAFKEKEVRIENIRTFCVNPESNRYKIMFDTREKEPIYIDTHALLDENNTEMKIGVLNAWKDSRGEIPISGNRIGPIENVNEGRNTIFVELDYPIMCRVTVDAVKIKGGEINE